MKKLTVVTACLWGDTKPIERWMDSCQRFGLDYSYYGVEERFVNWKETKIDRLITHLQDLDSEVVMFTDGFDSWMLGGEEEILTDFESFGSDIVLSAERRQYPNIEWGMEFPDSETSFRYPCAGGFIGKRKALIDALNTLRTKYMNVEFGDKGSEHKSNDQTLWTVAYLRRDLNFVLDHGNYIFLNMNGVSLNELDLFDGVIRVRETDMPPSVIHFNGPKGGSDTEKAMNLLYEIYMEKNAS